MNLSPDKILSFAPDPGTAQRAKSVAIRQRWLSLEGNERAIWGTLGNPADPFRTQVDFQGPAFHCSCPVRRQPCKHGIGLLLLFYKSNDAFRVVTDPPEWVDSWLKKRDVSLQKKVKPDRSPEEEALLAEKRREAREKRRYQMEEGLAELENWLSDLMRQGLASLEGLANSYWTDLAARMTDAKLGGLARRIRQLPARMKQHDWHENLLAEVGELYLIVKGFSNLPQLPEPLQDDLLNLAGVNLRKEEVLSGDGLSDHWLVAGQTTTEEEGNLLARRTWFAGEQSGINSLLLEFSWGGGDFETQWKPGSVVEGEVAFYPSAFPQRILFKQVEVREKTFELRHVCPDLETFSTRYAQALGAFPWLSQFPAFLENVIPVFQNPTFVLVDERRKMLPLVVSDTTGWKMVAWSGGHPLRIFGIWNGTGFQPLSLVVEGQFRSLAGV